MGKREKVLIILMVAAIGYGAFELFYDPGHQLQTSGPGTDPERVSQLSAAVLETLRQAELSEDESFILEKASTPWTSSPFHVLTAPDTETITRETPEETTALETHPALVYSGYLEMGNRRMAVINGVDYLTGDILTGGMYKVGDIAPGRVILFSLTGEGELSLNFEDVILLD